MSDNSPAIEELQALKDTYLAEALKLKEFIETEIGTTKEDLIAYVQAKVDEIKAEIVEEMKKEAEAIMSEKILELQAEFTKTVENMILVMQQYVDDKASDLQIQLEAKVQEAIGWP